MNPTVEGKILLFDLAGIEDSQLCDFLAKDKGHNIGVKYVIAWVGDQSIVKYRLYTKPTFQYGREEHVIHLGLADWFQFKLLEPNLASKELIDYFIEDDNNVIDVHTEL
jgi:hypothetical protein